MINKRINLSLIKQEGKSSKSFQNIVKAINGYLLRNRGAVSDFILIKDIVDRNIDSEEDSISSNLPIPLYLGLIGTMLGIIIGLIAMPSLSDPMNYNSAKTDEIVNTISADEDAGSIMQTVNSLPSDEDADSVDNSDQTMQGVDALLSGVKIAMIASVIGLLLTTINSFIFYHYRRKTENEKNSFFTFIQTQLLPILSKNTASSIQTLQANLLKFNEGFTRNMSQFEGVIKEVRTSFQSQLQVVEELKRIDVSNMAKYNIDVMKQLNSSFSKLKDLGDYLDNTNSFIKNTQKLNYTVSQQLDKIGDFGIIIKNFDSNAQGLVQGSKFLQSHFENFDKREQAISNKVADFDSKTGDMLEVLKNSFSERMKRFNEKDIQINSGFEELFSSLKKRTAQIFDDESQNIASIKKDMTKVSDNVNSIKGIPSNVNSLQTSIDKQNANIEKLIEQIAGKPLVFKPSKSIIVFMLFTGLIIIITCGLFTYKYLF